MLRVCEVSNEQMNWSDDVFLFKVHTFCERDVCVSKQAKERRQHEQMANLEQWVRQNKERNQEWKGKKE
jgi:hypothetical protein